MIGFAEMIIDNLRTANVQQAHKKDKIDFISLTPGSLSRKRAREAGTLSPPRGERAG